MTQDTYDLLYRYMLACEADPAHDRGHVLRVLYRALEIAEAEPDADRDVLIAACLLHDIGRGEEMRTPALRHAAVGAEKARDFLRLHGFDPSFTARVADCIAKHSYGPRVIRDRVEERILFDADKLDAAGALGTARTLLFHGQLGDTLYAILPGGAVSDGQEDATSNYFHQYQSMLKGLPDSMLTARGREMAAEIAPAAAEFYRAALAEAQACHDAGHQRLRACLKKPEK